MSTHRVLCTDSFAGAGLARLQESSDFEVSSVEPQPEEKLISLIKDFDAIVVRSATKVSRAVIEAGDRLKIIARAGIGVDNIDIAAATERGIFVINAPLGNTTSTAELSFAMLMSLSRNIPQAAASMAAGKWEKKRYKGSEIAQKTLAVIGLGRVGKEVAKRGSAFKMNVIGYDPYVTKEQATSFGVELKSLDEIYRSADYITLHTPLTKETENLITAKELALMKPTTRIINCARGGIVNEKDLANALREKIIAGAALDVYTVEPFNSDLFVGLDNCVTTPHLGASTAEAQNAVGVEIAQSLNHFFANGFVHSAINLPPMDAASLENARPQLALAEKLGIVAERLVSGAPKTITFSSNIENGQIFTLAAVKGVLTRTATRPPSFVNVLKRAKEREIDIIEQKIGSEPGRNPLFGVKLSTTDGEVNLRGELFDSGVSRITRFNEFYLDLQAKGNLLFVKGPDKPGVIAQVCTILGDEGVNIAEMHNMRNSPGQTALTAMRLDAPLAQTTLEKLEQENDVQWVKAVTL